jgi:hypothetical protein
VLAADVERDLDKSYSLVRRGRAMQRASTLELRIVVLLSAVLTSTPWSIGKRM